MVTPGDTAAVAQLLRDAPLEVVGRFADASNGTLLCEVDGGDVKAVYKPQEGEAPLWDFPSGTLYQREVAAYELDRALGWGMVPVTVVREEAPYGLGSVQLFVEHDPNEHYFTLLERGDVEDLRQIERMILFDLVNNNTDRKGGHVFRPPDGRLQLVDHGVCFHTDFKLRTVAWHHGGETVDRDDRAEVARVHGDLVAGGPLTAPLAALLSPAELAQVRERARWVAELERHLEPSDVGPRPFPWPLL